MMRTVTPTRSRRQRSRGRGRAVSAVAAAVQSPCAVRSLYAVAPRGQCDPGLTRAAPVAAATRGPAAVWV